MKRTWALLMRLCFGDVRARYRGDLQAVDVLTAAFQSMCSPAVPLHESIALNEAKTKVLSAQTYLLARISGEL